MNANETAAADAAQEELLRAIAFHGHKCPVLALGLEGEVHHEDPQIHEGDPFSPAA